MENVYVYGIRWAQHLIVKHLETSDIGAGSQLQHNLMYEFI